MINRQLKEMKQKLKLKLKQLNINTKIANVYPISK
jgi:hypothetical protein